jgi:preprotein translocase subunit SecD
VVALNLLSNSPQWLTNLRALPMYLGLDLRGGVHFLLQVDMKQALTKRLDSTAWRPAHADARQERAPCRHHARSGDAIEVRFRDAETRERRWRRNDHPTRCPTWS